MVLVRDAAASIEKCMQSILRSACFEQVLVIIDSRTKDHSVRILTRYAARDPRIQLMQYRWSEPGDFAAVRNAGINSFRTDYGFWLDADEEITQPGAIMNMLRNADGKAFSMWVISPLGAGTFDMYQPRLFPVVPGVKFECPVFERLDWSLKRNGIETVSTSYSPVFHRGYVQAENVARKNQRNLAILSVALRVHNLTNEQRNHLMAQYWVLGGR